MGLIETNKCYVCKFDPKTGRAIGSQKNKSLHWHMGDDGMPWVWCTGKCQRAYSIYEYTKLTGLKINDILDSNPSFEEAMPDTVNKMDWPKQFIALYMPKAKPGVEYLKKRGLNVDGGIYYDTAQNGIVFPYFFDNVFCGAQIRFIEPKDDHKITTLPGTRLSLLFFNWNQTPLPPHVKIIVVTEGAFNALSIQQSLDSSYENKLSPFLCVAVSGSNISTHQCEALRDLIDSGYKVIAAPDGDEAGESMAIKMIESKSATHICLPPDPKQDWNDLLQAIGSDLGRVFLDGVKKL